MQLDKRKIRGMWCIITVSQSGYFAIAPEDTPDQPITEGKELQPTIERADKLIRRAKKLRIYIPFTNPETLKEEAVTGIHAQNEDYLVFDLETEETRRVSKWSLGRLDALVPLTELPASTLEYRKRLEERNRRLRELVIETNERIEAWTEKHSFDLPAQVKQAIADFESPMPPTDS